MPTFLDVADIFVITVFSIDIILNFLTGSASSQHTRLFIIYIYIYYIVYMVIYVYIYIYIMYIYNHSTGGGRYIDKKDQRVIMHWRPVAVEYLKFWFLIDVISTLPPEAWGSDSSVIALHPTPRNHCTFLSSSCSQIEKPWQSGDTSAVRGARISKILRCFKISRLARIVQVI